jgi:AcrR family transcriptional regulator
VSKGETTRTSILDEALHVASTVGFEGLSIGQLAERTEMSKSGLFAHFRSKEQLQLQALDHAAARFTDVVARPTLKTPRGEPRVRELFERWIGWETGAFAGGCVFISASDEYDDQPGPMRDAVLQHQHDWRDFITTVVGTAVSEGHFRADVDPAQFTFMLQGVMLSYHHAGRLLRDPQALDRTRAAFEQLLVSAH